MSETTRIRHVDAWRFFAVSLVIAAHLIVHSNFGYLVDAHPFLRRLGRFGTLGVLIFFFISGFVICRGLAQEQAQTGHVNLRAFYVRRAFRIFPPLWIYLAALLGLSAAATADLSREQIGTAALFLCNLGFSCTWYAGHTWSLAYEEQFYLAFPLLFVALGLMARPKLAAALLFTCIGSSISARLQGELLGANYLMYVVFLLTGCAAALHERRVKEFAQSLSVETWLILLAALTLCVGLLPYPLEEYVKTILYPPIIALLVLGTPVKQSQLGAVFLHPLIGYLGRISYTVYLWQQLATAPWPGLAPWWNLMFVLCVWLLAHLSWQWLERPLISIGSKCSDSIKQKSDINPGPAQCCARD